MSSSTNRTRTLTTLGILTAIILVMTFTPLGYIKTMGLEITLLHIPVILGAALTGPAGGMVLGAVFGFTSFFQCFGLSTFGTTLFSINPAGTFIVCVIPRILLGLVAAYIYRGFDHLTGKWSGTITGALATICHTAMFMGTLAIFFYTSDYLQGFAAMMGTTNVFASFLVSAGLWFGRRPRCSASAPPAARRGARASPGRPAAALLPGSILSPADAPAP